jgi:hypothetical protein
MPRSSTNTGAKVAPLKLALRKARTSELDMLITLDGVDAA